MNRRTPPAFSRPSGTPASSWSRTGFSRFPGTCATSTRAAFRTRRISCAPTAAMRDASPGCGRGSLDRPPPSLMNSRLLHFGPRLLLTVLAAGAFLIALAAPYRLDTDTGFQLRSLQQWVRGESTSPGTLLLPDPQDLSRDVSLWSNWWPPGFPLLYAPLVAGGLPLAAALRLPSLLLFLAGAWGWLGL